MTLSPNTQITKENVGLLPKGAWLLLDGQPVQFINTFMGGIRAKYDSDKRTSALPFSRFTYIGPDLGDGWIGHSGGENPVPGMRVDVRTGLGFETEIDSVRVPDWRRVIAFRPALSPPASVIQDSRTTEIAPPDELNTSAGPVNEAAENEHESNGE